jgi:tRNA modification GTPase
LEAEVARRFAVTAAPALTRARHRAAVEECVAALSRFDPDAEIELAAEDLRLAVAAIGRITGRVDVDELLDVVFREFCIGK